MFRASLCPSSGENTTCYCIWGIFAGSVGCGPVCYCIWGIFAGSVGCGPVVGPCHHGMARPQVADRGTASDKEGSCE